MQLVFGVGFLFTDDIRALAKEFPNVDFACVDYTVTEGDTLPANLRALKFKEEEGSFLVGALCGLLTKTGTVGFVGGMEIPLIKKFEAGYRAGVAAVRPGGRVLVKYAGSTGSAFKDPTKGKELALAEYHQGADVIFHASGSTGLGVFEAAARAEQARDRRGLGPERRGAGFHPHLDGETGRGRGVQHHPRRARRPVHGRHPGVRARGASSSRSRRARARDTATRTASRSKSSSTRAGSRSAPSTRPAKVGRTRACRARAAG